MKDPGSVVIIGAGPTGLGAAYRLQELGVRDYQLFEARGEAGGLASSYVDPKGFTWDVGGHVHFSHYAYYDDVIARVLGADRLLRDREAWIWYRGRFVPYPFQYNLHRLETRDRERAVQGLEEARKTGRGEAPVHFAEWIERTFGSGIADLFMKPYNLKAWGYPLERLDASWVGDRVAVPDLERIRRSLSLGRDDASWGPNRSFLYPRWGGTGVIWRRLAELLDQSRLHWDTSVASVDVAGRHVYLHDGRAVRYDTLITSMPLDLLCGACQGIPAATGRAASRLVHSSVHIVGIGLEGGMPDQLRRVCWMYFPDAGSPYHRVTVLSNYSPRNVPEGGTYWSLMAEVCESPNRPVDGGTVVEEALSSLRHHRLVPPTARIVSRWHFRVEHGYPTPFLGRDEVLNAIHSALDAQRVFSRGRFGAWRYEVSNQDHCFMQGVELVDSLLGVGEEVTVNSPHVVNDPTHRSRLRRT